MAPSSYPQELEEAVGRVTGVRAGTERLVVLAETRTAQDGNEAIRAEVEQLAIELTGPLWGLWVWMVFGLLAPVFWVAIALAPTLARASRPNRITPCPDCDWHPATSNRLRYPHVSLLLPNRNCLLTRWPRYR